MKKIIPLLLIILLTFSGCVIIEKDVGTGEDNLKIVATIFPQYDFLREITKGTDAEVEMLVSPGKEVHGFESTLSDVAKVSECDLLVYVGTEDDKWIEDIPDSGNTRLALNDIITDYEDDHLWTSPKNAIKIVGEITSSLCSIDEENSEAYRLNAQKYVEELKKLDAAFEKAVNKSKSLVFAERFPFLNFAKDYGVKYYSAFEGCSTETEAGIKTINFLVEKVKEENIPAIFIIEFSDGVVAEKISDETGAEILLFHSCHNVTEEEFENGETYLSLMTQNLENLKTASGE